MVRLFLLLLALVSFSALSEPISEERLLFVFEMIRHGARTGQSDYLLLDSEGNNVFPVGTGMLTYSGMRQRYLYGRILREKYALGLKNMKILDEEYLQSQIIVKSTNYHRAIQSVQAELLGLYPPSEKNVLSNGEQDSLLSGKGMPPLKIRAAKELNSVLGDKSLVDGFTQVPIYLYTGGSVHDDIGYDGCQYLVDLEGFYYNDESHWEQFKQQYLPHVQDALNEAFDISEEEAQDMTFLQYQQHGDEILCEQFEGCPPRYPFTPVDGYYFRMMNKAELTNTFPGDAYLLWGSRMLRFPLAKLQERLEKVYTGQDSREDLKYILYSAHDIQLANLFKFMPFEDFNYLEIEFTAQFLIEAFQNTECLEQFGPEIGLAECTRLRITFNGAPLKVGLCAARNAEKGREGFDCRYGDFLEFYQGIVMKEDLDQMCYKKFEAPY